MGISSDKLSASFETFPTTSKSVYFYTIICNINPCNHGTYWYGPNTFQISIINCVSPPINTVNIKQSYSFNVKS